MHCIGRQTVEQTLSLFGSSVVQYAIFWYLVLRSNSGMVMTVAMVAAALPQAIVSVFGGVWADRWNRKLSVMFPDAVIAAVTICLSASMAVGWGDTGLILVVLVIRSAGGGIQTPAVQSFIPQIVPEAWLLRVNAVNGTLQTAISIASPAIAAALVNLMPLWMIMLVDVSTAIVGIGFVALIRLDDARLRRPGESSDDAPARHIDFGFVVLSNSADRLAAPTYALMQKESDVSRRCGYWVCWPRSRHSECLRACSCSARSPMWSMYVCCSWSAV